MRVWWVFTLAACTFTGRDSSQPSVDAAEPASDDALFDAAAADAAPIDAAPLTCPGGYMASNGSRYRFVSQAAPWLTAEQDCENDSTGLTHLAVLDAANEIATIDALSSASRTWIGLSDRITDGAWLWITSAAGPALGVGISDCGQVETGIGGRQVRGDSCATGRVYVCECDLAAADPDSY